jgi:hypothetical protein
MNYSAHLRTIKCNTWNLRRSTNFIHLISYESLCLLKILAKDRMARKKAIRVSIFPRKLVRTLAWISRRHKLSLLIN